MTIDEIYAIPVDERGWQILPNGNHIILGRGIVWEATDADSRIGNYSRIGNGSRIGIGSRIGNDSRIGDGSIIPNNTVWKHSPLTIQGTRDLVTNCAPGQINIGCRVFTFAEFLSASVEERAAYQEAAGYSKTESAEYLRIVEFVIANGVPAEGV